MATFLAGDKTALRIQPMEHIRESWLNVCVLAGFALLFTFRPFLDPDIWFHLAAGREIIGALPNLPATERFVYPLLGEPTAYPEWGYEVLIYGLVSAGGIPALSLFVGLLGGLTALFLFRAARTLAGPAAALAATGLAMAILEFRWIPRPEILLYLTLSGVIWLVLAAQKARWRWWLLVPAAWLLVQAHPSVLLVLGVAGLFALESTWRDRDWRPLAACAAAAAITGLNPYGYQQVILPLSFTADKELLSGISEFLPALSTEYRWRFIMASLGGVVAVIALRAKVPLAFLALHAMMVFLAFRFARNTALLAFPILLLASTALQAQSRRAIKVAVAALALPVFAQAEYGWGVPADSVPDNGVAAVKQLIRGGLIVDLFHIGNYVEWKLGTAYPVLADGRNFSYNKALQLHDRLLSAMPGWDFWLDRHQVSAVMTPLTLDVSGEPVPLAWRLLDHPEWVVVAAEPEAITFVRRTIATSPAVPVSQVWNISARRLEKLLKTTPDSPTATQTLSMIRSRQKQSLD